jgi:MOSC domain-containing protein YiiM
MARLLSVNVGLPRDVTWQGQTVSTGIFKQAVDRRVAVRTLNLDGDRQADLSVHGCPFKAVYCYPIEHYGPWKAELGGRELPIAIFGENLTTEGVDEASVHLGDRFSIGSAQVIVTQPRMPCYKLGIRFQSATIIKQFAADTEQLLHSIAHGRVDRLTAVIRLHLLVGGTLALGLPVQSLT